MRWTGAFLLCAALAASSGCRSCSRVEAELAAREKDVRTLREELDRATFTSDLLTKELAARDGMPGPDGVVRPPALPYPVRSIRVGGRTSALPDDDGLEVQIEPLDTEGQAIKAPGIAQVVVHEVTPEGQKRPFMYWDLPADQLRQSWQSGLFNSGYILAFKWNVPPREERLRVTAKFRMMDGRTFEAERTITVRAAAVPGKAPEKMPPAEGPTLTKGRPAAILRPVPVKAE